MAYRAVDEAFKIARKNNALLREALESRKNLPPTKPYLAVEEAFRLARQQGQLRKEAFENTQNDENDEK